MASTYIKLLILKLFVTAPTERPLALAAYPTGSFARVP